MEFVRENIHMNIQTASGQSELTLEDDMNLSDARPDMEKVLLEEGKVELTEVKVGTDQVLVRGNLSVKVLYITDDRACVIDKMEGSISFEEEMDLPGVQPNDTVSIEAEVTDLSVGLINSRKISVRSLISLMAKVQALQDEELICQLAGEEEIACLCKEQSLSQLAVCKKDIVRHKQELEIASDYPDIVQILWQNVQMTRLDVRPENGRIMVSGELRVIVLYEGDGENQPIRYFEKNTSFQEYIEEKKAKDTMYADVHLHKSSLQVDVKPDFDGRERVLQLELVYHMDIALYEKIRIEMLADAYGLKQEIVCQTKEAVFQDVIQNSQAMTTVEGEMKIRGSHKKLLQVLGCMGDVCLQQTEIKEKGIDVIGFAHCKCLYITNDDMIPYDVVSARIPFTYHIDIADICENDIVHMQVQGSSFSVSVTSEESMAVRATIQFGLNVIRNEQKEILCNLTKEAMDAKKRAALPQYCIYRALAEDSLWDIGKKYIVPAEQIKELNGLTTDSLTEGQNLLIVR